MTALQRMLAQHIGRIYAAPVRKPVVRLHPALRRKPVPAHRLPKAAPSNLPPVVQSLVSRLPGGSVAIAVDNVLSKAPLPVQIIAAPLFLGSGLVKAAGGVVAAALDGSVHYSAADIALEKEMKAGNLDPTARLVTRKASGDAVPRGANTF